MNPFQRYILTFPERVVRASGALIGGLLHESTSLLLPSGVRRSRLYQATVARLLRIVVELVGDVQGVFPADEIDAGQLLVRKTAGNVVEMASFLAVGWSPIWLLAAASDLIGGARVYLATLVTELKSAGALPSDADIDSFEELLTALEGTSGTLADSVDVVPLSLQDLRSSWERLRSHVSELPSAERLAALFTTLQTVSANEQRSLLEMSSIVALGAVRAGIAMGDVHIFGYYRSAFDTIARHGLLRYLGRLSAPYFRRIGRHFAPGEVTMTERLLVYRGKIPAASPANGERSRKLRAFGYARSRLRQSGALSFRGLRRRKTPEPPAPTGS